MLIDSSLPFMACPYPSSIQPAWVLQIIDKLSIKLGWLFRFLFGVVIIYWYIPLANLLKNCMCLSEHLLWGSACFCLKFEELMPADEARFRETAQVVCLRVGNDSSTMNAIFPYVLFSIFCVTHQRSIACRRTTKHLIMCSRKWFQEYENKRQWSGKPFHRLKH